MLIIFVFLFFSLFQVLFLHVYLFSFYLGFAFFSVFPFASVEAIKQNKASRCEPEALLVFLYIRNYVFLFNKEGHEPSCLTLFLL